MNGAVWARIIGVVIAMISIVANLAYANTYPVWAIVAITIDILVIYALTVRGNEVRG